MATNAGELSSEKQYEQPPKPRDALNFPVSYQQQISPFLAPPPPSPDTVTHRLYVTLTFATSLDSNLSISPGVQTALSGPESKAMTHYLRSKHDAILIGVGTAVADNPSLNCRIAGVGGYGGVGLQGQPRPIVLDPNGRWDVNEDSKLIKLVREGRGVPPWILTLPDVYDKQREEWLESLGGKVISFSPHPEGAISWHNIVSTLAKQDVKSVMIEGGGKVINELLSKTNIGLVDSVIITIAPTWLGKGGVQVCPEARTEGEQRVPVGRLMNVKWVPLGDDVVLCGRPVL